MKFPVFDYDEIKDGDHFEELVAAYFRSQKENKESNITQITIA